MTNEPPANSPNQHLPTGEKNQPSNYDQLEVIASRGFLEFITSQNISITFSTYQAGKLFTIGRSDAGQMKIYERSLPRCMGFVANGDSTELYVSSHFQIHHFINQLGPGMLHEGHDRLFLPRVSYNTGDLDVHDMVITPQGDVLFVATMFSCIAKLTPGYSFTPWWQPPFISRITPEDKCHLNGLTAGDDGQPAYATAVSDSDLAGGWRDHRSDGGLVIHIPTNEIVATGLSMPHSPRLYKGKLWLHNSGTGHFGYLDLANGKFEEVVFCPGYLRGLAFTGKYAIAGLSKKRKEHSFNGLALDDNLAKHKARPKCALYVIDLDSGAVVHNIVLEGFVEELYDIQILPGVKMPMLVGFLREEIKRMYSIG